MALKSLSKNNSSLIRLDRGESSHSPPNKVLHFIQKINKESFRYSPRSGLVGLKESLITKLKKKNSLVVNENEITLTSGASMGIFSSIFSTIKENQSVLIPEPCYPSYLSILKMLRLKPILYNPKEPLKSLKSQSLKTTKAIICNYPHNPTGVVMSESILQDILQIVEKCNLYLISDETYEDFAYNSKQPIFSSRLNKDKLISIFSFSKTYGMPTLRLGYVVSNNNLSKKIESIQWTTSMAPSLLSQQIVRVALESEDGYLKRVKSNLMRARNLAYKTLSRYNIDTKIPEGGFYYWIKIPTKLFADEFTRTCLEKHNVMVMPGTAFGKEGKSYVRLSFALEYDLVKKGFERVGRFMSVLSNN